MTGGWLANRLPIPLRVWLVEDTVAIEGCNGVSKHLAQRLFAAGERVVDVSTRRAALVRVFATIPERLPA